MAKYKDILNATDNSRVYKIALKHYREHMEINCSWCPYHRGENDKRGDWKRKSWKWHRNNQYKVLPIQEELV